MRYILITALALSALFPACIQKPKNPAPVIQNTSLDTIQTRPAAITANPVLFETAFAKGTKQELKNLEFTLYGVKIGSLKITSGRIVACDPLLIEEYGLPFTYVFPKGSFPVELAIARLENKGETVAFARIRFSDAPVARWEYALLKDQQQLPPGSEDAPGYIVDAGHGSFMDEDALKALDRRKVVRLSGDVYKDINSKFRNGWGATVYNSGESNLAVFTSGLGDGRYSTYIGFDAAGQPCRLLTDFEIFKWKK